MALDPPETRYTVDSKKSARALSRADAFDLLHEIRMFNLAVVQSFVKMGFRDSPEGRAVMTEMLGYHAKLDEKMKALVFDIEPDKS